MSGWNKKIISALLICVMLIVGAWVVSRDTWTGTQTDASTEQENAAQESLREAYAKEEEQLVLWYEDETFAPFFELAAERYFAKTGIKVAVECRKTLDYLGDIYDQTMQDERYPDVYLISGDNLEEAYLYGLASVNEADPAGAGAVPNAVTASTYGEKLLGYPLSFHTCVFIYQTDYFGAIPDSLQSIVDYSNENEPAENVEFLLEWDVHDAYYDFPFISNSVTFEKTEAGVMEVRYDEELYQRDLEYFETILASFSLDTETVTEQSIIDNFRAGRTLSAIVDTDFLYRLDGYSYALMQIPDLNEELAANTCAGTDMLLVNDFTKNEELAADFARFATVELADELYPLTGHFSVIPSDDPNWVERVSLNAYADAVLMPDSQDAKNFWVELEETFLKYF